MDISFKLDDSVLKEAFAQIEVPFVPFKCNGVSGESKPTIAHLKIVNFKGENGGEESYVMCGRLREFYGGMGVLVNPHRCVENKGVGEALIREDYIHPEKYKECPYFHPKRE